MDGGSPLGDGGSLGGGGAGLGFSPGQKQTGRRRGRLFGDGAPLGGAVGTAALVLVLALLGVLFLAASCLG